MQTNYQHLLVQQNGSVLTLTMNRPEVLNAFNDTMLEELTEAVEAAQDLAFETSDHREGVMAFLQKRPPKYTGR